MIDSIINRPSPNWSHRRKSISAIIIHDTASKTAESALDWLTKPESKVSCHYLVARNGQVYRLVPEDLKAWHAGESSLHGENDVNDFSIGIELEDMDNDPYPDKQMEELGLLCGHLCRMYKIPLNRVVGHQHIAPGRKVDPGPDFPWYKFLHDVSMCAT